MLDKWNDLLLRREDLEAQLADPAVYGDSERLRTLQRELKELIPAAEAAQALKAAQLRRAEAEALLRDPEMRELAQEELSAAKAEAERLQEELKILLLPKDPNDSRNVILEIRSAEGGEEAALFARDLLRMYQRYAQRRGWQMELLSLNETELGGVKECSALIEGEGAFSRLKFESGGHQVKRVPETESNGRIQTSAATVAVLPEMEEVDVEIAPEDLQIDTYRSSGAGGQHVNKTESAIRITHIPTGLVVECQDERSQYKNKDKAMKVLRSRLYEQEQARQAEAVAGQRRSQVGSGSRGDKIRIYRFREKQVVDVRTGQTMNRLNTFLDGDLDEIIDALVTADMAARLKGSGE